MTLTCQQLPAGSANDVLMRKASEQRLPLSPASGSGGTATGMDCLVADVIDLLTTAGLGFPVSLCDSEGMYIVRFIARVLWRSTATMTLQQMLLLEIQIYQHFHQPEWLLMTTTTTERRRLRRNTSCLLRTCTPLLSCYLECWESQCCEGLRRTVSQKMLKV